MVISFDEYLKRWNEINGHIAQPLRRTKRGLEVPSLIWESTAMVVLYVLGSGLVYLLTH